MGVLSVVDLKGFTDARASYRVQYSHSMDFGRPQPRPFGRIPSANANLAMFFTDHLCIMLLPRVHPSFSWDDPNSEQHTSGLVVEPQRGSPEEGGLEAFSFSSLAALGFLGLYAVERSMQ